MQLVEDPDRKRATSFGRVAADYDRARPTYPAEAVGWLLGGEPLEVVDLGAGTGKLTAVLLDAGHHVVAVEPLRSMRAKLTERLPRARVLSGSAEAIPLPDACADAAVAGQAFHWFELGRALTEIARVLRPGGTLGLVWNFRDDLEQWMRELSAIVGQDGLSHDWTHTLESLPIITALEHRTFRLEHRVDRESLLALVGSWSHVASLPRAERQALLQRVGALWDGQPQLVRTEAALLTYRTEAYRVRLEGR